MTIISLFYRECTEKDAIRIMIKTNAICGNVKKIMNHKSQSTVCFVCGKEDKTHIEWKYIYSWFFSKPEIMEIFTNDGFKIITTYYENNNDYINSILNMKYIGLEWIDGIKRTINNFYNNVKNRKMQYANIASLISFENEMNNLSNEMKLVSNIVNPYVNHNPYVCTGFVYKNITYNKHINYVSKKQIVILSINKIQYPPLWNITNNLLSLITKFENNEISPDDLKIMKLVSDEYLNSFKEISSYVNKQANKK